MVSERWSINESSKIYNMDNWGADLFSINKKGNVCVHPSPNSKHSIDLRALVDDLIKRKIKPPILLRFMNILEGCRHTKVQHLVYASSSSVYGANTKLPIIADAVSQPKARARPERDPARS